MVLPAKAPQITGLRLGIDLGGTKMEIIALDSAGTELARRRITTPREYEAGVRALTGLVEWAEASVGRSGTIGIGIPGSASPRTGLIRNANSTWLNGKPFQHDLEAALGRTVRLENDANCMAISEATDGAGKDAAVVFGVILGTGTGGGVVVHGEVWRGLNAIAGEWGHNPLPWPGREELPGPACYCGKHGCIETFLSGPGLAADHARVTGERCSGTDIAAKAAAGDPAAGATLVRYQDRLVRSLASVVNILDPNVIILGGGVSNISRIYEGITEKLSLYCFSDGVTTPVRRAQHGDSTGVRGAAWLWPATPAVVPLPL